jgi:hypothetical protein
MLKRTWPANLAYGKNNVQHNPLFGMGSSSVLQGNGKPSGWNPYGTSRLPWKNERNSALWIKRKEMNGWMWRKKKEKERKERKERERERKRKKGKMDKNRRGKQIIIYFLEIVIHKLYWLYYYCKIKMKNNSCIK